MLDSRAWKRFRWPKPASADGTLAHVASALDDPAIPQSEMVTLLPALRVVSIEDRQYRARRSVRRRTVRGCGGHAYSHANFLERFVEARRRLYV